MELSLYTCIQNIKRGDKEQMLVLLETFEPILKKYTYRLRSEDALQELQCFLLSFAKEIPLEKMNARTNGVIISYVSKAIYHRYIALSKSARNQSHTIYLEDQKDYDLLQYDAAFSESDTYTHLFLHDLKCALTAEEYNLIYEHFFQQRSIQEIANKAGKTRQAINQCKNTALRKLRRYWGL